MVRYSVVSQRLVLLSNEDGRHIIHFGPIWLDQHGQVNYELEIVDPDNRWIVKVLDEEARETMISMIGCRLFFQFVSIGSLGASGGYLNEVYTCRSRTNPIIHVICNVCERIGVSLNFFVISHLESATRLQMKYTALNIGRPGMAPSINYVTRFFAFFSTPSHPHRLIKTMRPSDKFLLHEMSREHKDKETHLLNVKIIPCTS